MFISPVTLAILVGTTIVSTLLPGQDFFYVARNSVGGHRLNGLAAVAGIYTGLVFYVLAIAIGLGSVFERFHIIAEIIRILGVCYLLYLSVILARQVLRAGDADILPADGAQTFRLSRTYGGGILVTLLNPKTAIYFMAILPQLVDASKGYVSLQLMVLGFPMITMSCSIYAVESLIMSRYGPRFLSSPKVTRILYGVLAAIFFSLSVGLMLVRL